MAYETGTAADLGDLLSKLDTFLVANGYTQNDFDDGATVASQGFANWTKGTLCIGVKWIANNPDTMSLHQALAYSGSGLPGTHTDDSGNGYNAAFGSDVQLESERCVSQMGNGPFVSYHFFENDASPSYVHVVVEVEPEVFRHFGWGEMDKFTDWTGGEYCYGHYQNQNTFAQPSDTQTVVSMDAISGNTGSTARRQPTIHAEDLPHQAAAEKWLQHMGNVTSVSSRANWTDSAGEDKQISFGGYRGGPIGFQLGPFRSDVSTGHIPLYPLSLFTRDFVNNFVYYLGSVPDVRGVNIFNFSPGQEVTIGTDVWVLFPSSRRSEDSIANRTFYQGIAYRKVTA